MTEVPFVLLFSVLGAAFVAQASPGPATMAIGREAMVYGRSAGVRLALGVTTGSWIWSAVAACGMGAVILAQDRLVVLVRCLAVAYLSWLAWKSARAALAVSAKGEFAPDSRPRRSYAKGLLIHLTNPKAILFFGALYALGLPRDASIEAIILVAVSIGLQSLVIFVGLALILSHPRIAAGYLRAKRGLEAVFAAVFGTAAIALLLDIIRSFRRASSAS